ncbi:MAG: S8 family serine peptidase [Clostridia bacterium]|nr:S8 family serine peptidase [Clostridia bacterium]
MQSYIVRLRDFSEGARLIARFSRLTHILPFISAVVAEGENFSYAENYVVSASKVAKVSVVMDSVRQACRTKKAGAPFGGRGVTVAVIDTGLSPHLDFLLPNRVSEFVDVINGKTEMYDDNGHGTAVTGALAGSGLMSSGNYAGIASGANVISIKAISANGEGSTADILQSMQWIWSNCEKYGIKVVCTSFGTEPQGKNDPLVAGVEALHSKGIIVVASSGNDGPAYGTVKSPGISPFALTVGGASINEKIKVAEFSSRGKYNGIIKPDVVAPSENVVCPSKDSDYSAITGTSISTPLVAGACALVLEKHPYYTPDKVKEVIMKNARRLDDKTASGSGMLDLSFLDLL